MSIETKSPAHDDHGHGDHDDGAVHAHISSTPFYVGIFLALLFFTLLTVGQSYVDLGKLNLLFVIMIATAKASLVVTFFMHLRHDNRFNALIFVCGLLFIGVFFTYTMNDTERRGELDVVSEEPLEPRSGLLAPGGFDIQKAEEEHKKAAEEEEKKSGHGGPGHPATEHVTAPEGKEH
jgi:cytochrome c oxidase subunit 4